MNYDIIEKYNLPIPRYTSYPTVPYWYTKNMENINQWGQLITKTTQLGKAKQGISVYVHLPFCEQLCTYCGCNKRITINHDVEKKYVETILKEWNYYIKLFGEQEKLIVKEIHLGGGTPTFFSPKNLEKIIKGILSTAIIGAEYEFSFEGHPNNTTKQHLQTLYDVGFRRVSFGVQDLDLKVQMAINRLQPIDKTKQVTQWAREIGYTSVNYDLVYGLPFQNMQSIENTISQVIELKPDRIAFYSYAHVPWTSKSQRAYDESNLPVGKEKFMLYETGKQMFIDAGYEDVGMDHFALPADPLLQSKKQGTIHRNFMGYTTNKTEILIGLGTSAISDVFLGYRQNKKTVEEYYELIDNDGLAIDKGLDLSGEDLIQRNHILNIACKGTTSWEPDFLTQEQWLKLKALEDDDIIVLENNKLTISKIGWGFLRNVCAVFDKYLINNNANQQNEKPIFSKSI